MLILAMLYWGAVLSFSLTECRLLSKSGLQSSANSVTMWLGLQNCVEVIHIVNTQKLVTNSQIEYYINIVVFQHVRIGDVVAATYRGMEPYLATIAKFVDNPGNLCI